MIVYLASPYSHSDPAVMRERFEKICEVSARFMRDGVNIFSPIAHTHPIAQYGLQLGWDFWKDYDEKIIAVCGELWVCTMDGWQESKGVQAEIKIAERLEVPVRFVNP